jgi:hypothetical protein
MSRRCGFSLVSMLLAANFAFGQDVASDGPLSSYFNDFRSRGPGAFSVQPEYMLWFVFGSRADFSISSTGGTVTQLADGRDATGLNVGGRLTLGYWEMANNPWITEGSIKTLGSEMRFFLVPSRSVNFTADTAPNLFRPFFDVNNRVGSAFLVAAPDIATGSISAHSKVDFWGAEANVWKNIYYDEPGTTCAVDVMAGFRFLNGNSNLDMSSISVFNQTIAAGSAFASFAGNRLQVLDSFATRNYFYGGQVGIKGQVWLLDPLRIEGSFRLALGDTNQNLAIAGSQVRTFADGRTAFSNAGLFALASNIGNHQTNRFTQVPEGEIKISYPIGDHLTFSLGLSILYWNKLLRAEDQVDRSLDITQIPNFPIPAGTTATGLGRPGVSFSSNTGLLVLGTSFGVEVRW